MSIHWVWFKSLGVGIGGAITFLNNCAIAQITPDNTLPENSRITTQGRITTIEGGTQVGNNLFHSFKEFSIDNGSTAEFNNTANVQNIISRVTGNSASNIYGLLKAQYSANLFLINPNGIIFGPNASLNIGGSFVASTASSLNFADGSKFSATDPQTTPLLKMSVPFGLQFGPTTASIRNQSQAISNYATNSPLRPVGLQVKPGKTLALVGGDIKLEGGNLTAESGRIELGSVAGNSLVSLNPINQGWLLGYEHVKDFQNIQLIRRTGDGSEVASRVNANTKDGDGGNIQVRGNIVELIGGNVLLTTQATGMRDGGDLTITSRKLIVRDGAQVTTATRGQGNGGKLIVNASESVEVSGSFRSPEGYELSSALFSSTAVAGKAGDITITTGTLRIQEGGDVETLSTASFDSSRGEFIAGTGSGGNLTVNAHLVELVGTSTGLSTGLFASTETPGDAGQITINTGQLIIRNGAELSVSSKFEPNYTYPEDRYILGKAGELNVTARSILLDNGQITSNSESGQGGNITLQVQDLLSMRRNSKISTNSGKGEPGGDGGNITINAPNGLVFAAPLENSDITANAFFGSGGKITINADSIFGFVQRDRADLERLLQTKDPDKLDPNDLPTNDITAFSQQNPSLNGVIEINSPDVDPSKGLVELPVNAVDAQDKIVAGCNSAQRIARASFITTGRGGIASSPKDALISDAILTDWIALEGQDENRAAGLQNRPVTTNHTHAQKINFVNIPTQIVEAQGWVVDRNGNVVLVAKVPTATAHSSALNSASCAVN